MFSQGELIHALQHVVAVAERTAKNRKKRRDVMPDDLSKTGSDRKLISLEQDHEVRDWATSMGCSEAQLREAVKAVGNSADEVRRYINNRKG